jgi:hypothetical protein
MKRFVLFLILASAGPMMYGQEAKPHNNADEGNAAAPSKNATSPAGQPLSVVNQQRSQGKKEDEAGQRPSYFRELLLPANFINLLLVGVGIAGIVIAVSTLRKIERQTKAAEDAAETALLSAQALTSAERPWLTVDVEPIDRLAFSFQFSVRNLGRTPAMLIGTSVVHVVCKALPDEPGYPDGMAAFESKREESGEVWMLAPSETWKFKAVDVSGIEPGWLMGQVAFRDMQSKERNFFFFGKVQYRDVFAPREVHETKFCYTYNLAAFQRHSAPKYNGYT